MARRSGLGRGLGALIPGEGDEGDVPDDATSASAAYRELPISALSKNRNQPRTDFDEAALTDLAASIAEVGVLQPVLVRSLGNDEFELIAGERRWRAAQLAKLTTIPALVRQVGDQTSLEHAIVENLHRRDLNPLEEAAGYQHLIDEYGLTQNAVATRAGRSRSTITNLLRLFQLPAAVQGLLVDRELSAGHGRALLGLESSEEQLAMARLTVREDLSVRELERRVKGDKPLPVEKPSKSSGSSKSKSPQAKPAALLELEQLLEDHLQTQVDVSIGANKGRLTIEFADIDDLQRLYLAMVDGQSTAS